MRSTIIALTVVFWAPAAAMALPTSGDPESGAAGGAIQQRQILPGGVAGSDQDGVLGGKVILAKGDKSGTGPGAGGQKGQRKGGNHGKQKKDKKDKP